MDKKILELIAAIDRAGACRKQSPIESICHRCWSDVAEALEAVRQQAQDITVVGDVHFG